MSFRKCWTPGAPLPPVTPRPIKAPVAVPGMNGILIHQGNVKARITKTKITSLGNGGYLMEIPAKRGRPKTNGKCTECSSNAVARGLCAKHYAQKQRGRLGKTRAKAKDGEAATIKVFVGLELLNQIKKRAKKEKRSVSELCKGLLFVAMTAPGI